MDQNPGEIVPRFFIKTAPSLIPAECSCLFYGLRLIDGDHDVIVEIT